MTSPKQPKHQENSKPTLTDSEVKDAILVDKLCKVYPEKKDTNRGSNESTASEGLAVPPALDNLSLCIPRGLIFGLLGPNGAGKSTFINILAGLAIKTSGYVSVWGINLDEDARNARARMGVMPQEINLDPFFKPFDLLEIIAGYYGVKKKDRDTMGLLREIKLEDQAFSYARSLSGGMRRRLMIAKALVHRPPILILDEPTAGVDVELRQQLWSLVKKLNKQGVTVILTTHYLQEAEELCDRIAIINHGKLIIEQDKSSLIKIFDTKTLLLQLPSAPKKLPAILDVCRVSYPQENLMEIVYPPSKMNAGQIIAACIHSGIEINDITIRESDLEEVFLRLVDQSDSATNPKIT